VSEENELHRSIGTMLAQIEVLNREMRDLKVDVKIVRDDFASLKGGARVMMGISAVAGSSLTWALSKFFGPT
jgi:hypothetical protein